MLCMYEYLVNVMRVKSPAVCCGGFDCVRKTVDRTNDFYVDFYNLRKFLINADVLRLSPPDLTPKMTLKSETRIWHPARSPW